MDNADLRRGKITVHKKWNKNIGILSGDILMIYAYKLLEELSPKISGKIIKRFNEISIQVCEGQQYDMNFEVENEISLSVEEIKNVITSEERIYRFRCVEGWSMVVPWLGFPLSKLLNKVKPTSKAKFVKFTSVYDPDQMKGQRFPVLNWPYKEGLRIDEAMHPLTIMVTGLYGKELPNQNGAPLRLIVPWKYGFKSAKAIVNIKFVEKMPVSSWMNASPKEYGFYSNVNPNVSHPRWSQATERVIGENIYSPRIKTVMFNGYGDEVAGLYDGMDLRKNF